MVCEWSRSWRARVKHFNDLTARCGVPLAMPVLADPDSPFGLPIAYTLESSAGSQLQLDSPHLSVGWHLDSEQGQIGEVVVRQDLNHGPDGAITQFDFRLDRGSHDVRVGDNYGARADPVDGGTKRAE